MQLNEFPLRLSKLRLQKGVSARNMSLLLGQNPGYISGIENGKTLPSMSIFFDICEYLDITPSTFFEAEIQNPKQNDELWEKINKLPEQARTHLSALIDDLLLQQTK